MKRILIVLIALCFLVVSGCSNAVSDTAGEDNDSNTTGESIEVDKGLFDVTITLPVSMVESENIEATIEEAKGKGIKEVVVNDDGSLTYKMSKSVHGQIMKELRESLNETVEDLINGSDFTSIRDIKYNTNLTSITLIVDKGVYESSLDGFAVFGFGLAAMYYQLFDGVSPDNITVTINIEDFATGEVFQTIVYPDALEALDD